MSTWMATWEGVDSRRGLQPRTFHRAVRRARGGPRTVTLTGAPVKRVDWECGQKLTVQPARARLGVHFLEAHPEKTLYQDAARRSTGRLAESAARCDRQRGRAPPERSQGRG